MRWMWIDRIAELDKGRRCVAVKNVSLAEEHLHDHFPAAEGRRALPIHPATLIIEGFAQTAGILVGHARDFKEKVILAKIGKATFERDVTAGQTLYFTAEIDRIDENGASTHGVVEVVDQAACAADPASAQHQPVGQIDMMFSHIDRNMQGLDFPEHNFVFTDQFFDLIHNSGIKV